MYIFGVLSPLTEFCQMQNSLCVQVLRSPILAALLHGTRAVRVSQTAAFSRGRYLYSAGRPSRCASAHILGISITTKSCQRTYIKFGESSENRSEKSIVSVANTVIDFLQVTVKLENQLQCNAMYVSLLTWLW